MLSVAVTLLCLAGAGAAVPEGPEYPSAEWFQREAQNYAKTQEEPEAQMASPGFQTRWNAQGAANLATYLERSAAGTWPWEHRGNLCAYWNEQCTGEPFFYPGVDPFYDEEADEGLGEPTVRRAVVRASLHPHVVGPACS